MNTPSIADLRHRVSILEKQDGLTDEMGGMAAPSWVEVGKGWFQIEPMSGEERRRAEQIGSTINHKAWCRFRKDITLTSKHVLVFKGRRFTIASVLNVGEANEWLRLELEEVVS